MTLGFYQSRRIIVLLILAQLAHLLIACHYLLSCLRWQQYDADVHGMIKFFALFFWSMKVCLSTLPDQIVTVDPDTLQAKS